MSDTPRMMTLETLFRVLLDVPDRRLIRVESFLCEHIHREHFSVFDCKSFFLKGPIEILLYFYNTICVVSVVWTLPDMFMITRTVTPDNFRFLSRVGIFKVIKVRVEFIYWVIHCRQTGDTHVKRPRDESVSVQSVQEWGVCVDGLF